MGYQTCSQKPTSYGMPTGGVPQPGQPWKN
jgi:hypothetical protein